MDDQVRAAHELRMSPVAGVQDRLQSSRKAHRSAKAFPRTARDRSGRRTTTPSVSMRYPRQVAGWFRYWAFTPMPLMLCCPFRQIAKGDLRRQLVEFYGKIGELHLPCEHIGQRGAYALRRTDGEFVSGYEKRSEEGKPLNVVPVRMAEQNGRPKRTGNAVVEVDPERPRAGAAIEDQPLALDW